MKKFSQRLHSLITSLFDIWHSAGLQNGLPKSSAHHETEAQEEQGGSHQHNEAVHEVIRTRTSVARNINNVNEFVGDVIQTKLMHLKRCL